MKVTVAATLLILTLSLPVLAKDMPAGQAAPPDITVLSTMVASFLGEGEWGFAALLEFEDEVMLFDTGFKADTVKRNAELMQKNLSDVETVVLSHFHSDHTGGLLSLRRAFMAQNSRAFSRVYVAEGFFRQRYREDGAAVYSLSNPGFTESFDSPEAFREAAQSLGIRFLEIDEPTEIRPGVVLTGPIPRVHDERNVSPGFFLKGSDGRLTRDTVPESQVMGINTEQGWTLLSGCGHAGIVNAGEYLRSMRKQPVHLAVGGFHLFRASDDVVQWTGRALQRFGVEQFVGAHCTGAHATRVLANQLQLPRSAVSIGAIGTRIDRSGEILPSSIE